MKRVIFYLLGTSVLCLAVLFVPKEGTVINQPNAANCLDLVPIALPTSYTTPDYTGETFGNFRNFEINGEEAYFYVETDVNGYFYYIGNSPNLTAYLDLVPNGLLFQGMGSEYDTKNAGEHQECMAICRDIDRGDGRGACKVDCWIDTAIKVIDVIMPL